MLRYIRPVSDVRLFFLLGLLLWQFTNVQAQHDGSEPEIYGLFERAIEKTHNEEFEEALSISNTMKEKYPDDPAGVFALIITYQSIMENYRVRTYENELKEELEASVKLSKQVIKRDKKNGKSYFYLGCAYGTKSIDSARRGKWLEAFRKGTQVMGNFKRAVAYSPEFYDAYYGLGLFKYWVSAKSSLIRAFGDNRKEGIAQMRLVLDKGRFLKTAAMYGLLAAYTNEKDYDLAFEMADRLYEKYPKNPNLLYRRGTLHQEFERWQEARAAYGELYAVLQETPYQSRSFQVECLYRMALCEFNLGKKIETKRFSIEANKLSETCDFEKELDGPLISFEDVKKELVNLTAKVEDIQLSEAQLPPAGKTTE